MYSTYNGNHKFTVTDSILATARAIEEKQNKIKSTCWLAGYKEIGKTTARVILGSKSKITVSAAHECIAKTTGNKLHLFAPSITEIDTDKGETYYVSAHVWKPKYETKLATAENVASMSSITATSYLDVELNSVWERKEMDGNQYLIKANEESPSDVLRTSLLASTDSNYRIDTNDLEVNANVNDYVQFFMVEANSSLENTPFMEIGRVKEVTANCVSLAIEDNGMAANITIKPDSIVRVVATGGEAKSREEVIEFLKQIYGPAYASLMDNNQAFK